MQIKLTRNVFVEGQSCSTGDVLEVKDAIGRSLILMGKAIETKENTPPDGSAQPQRIVIDANDGLSEEEISEAARVLQGARHTTLEATRATGLPKKVTSKPKKKG